MTEIFSQNRNAITLLEDISENIIKVKKHLILLFMSNYSCWIYMNTCSNFFYLFSAFDQTWREKLQQRYYGVEVLNWYSGEIIMQDEYYIRKVWLKTM